MTGSSNGVGRALDRDLDAPRISDGLKRKPSVRRLLLVPTRRSIARSRRRWVVRFAGRRSFDVLDEQKPSRGHGARQMGLAPRRNLGRIEVVVVGDLNQPRRPACRYEDPRCRRRHSRRRSNACGAWLRPRRDGSSSSRSACRSSGASYASRIVTSASAASSAACDVEAQRRARRRNCSERCQRATPCRGREGGEQRAGGCVPADRQGDDALLLDGDRQTSRGSKPAESMKTTRPCALSAPSAAARPLPNASGAAGNNVGPGSVPPDGEVMSGEKDEVLRTRDFDLPLEGGVAAAIARS